MNEDSKHGHTSNPPAQIAWLLQGLRASAGIPVTAVPRGVSPAAMLILWAISNAAWVLPSRMWWVESPSFSISGWLYGWASVALLIAVVWLGMAVAPNSRTHPTPVAAWLAMYAVSMVPISVAGGIWYALMAHEQLPGWASQPFARWAVFAVMLTWLGLAAWRITRRLLRKWIPAAVLVAAVIGVQVVSSLWLNSSAWQQDRGAAEDADVLELSQEIFEEQEALLAGQLNTVARQDDVPVQTFGIVYAPYAEDVFLRESQVVSDVLSQRMGHANSVITLLNHARTVKQRPWATPKNFRRALNRVAEVMDRERDVLILYLTSHGGRDHHLASSHWPLTVPSLTAEEVRQWLDEGGVKFRAVIVSACYSGGWIDPLANEDSLVITAAARDSTSYGCGRNSELTFFGKALFDEELRHTLSFEDALLAAKPRIHQREVHAGKSDGPSNPQMRVGSGFRTHWEEWTKHRVSGAVSGRP